MLPIDLSTLDLAAAWILTYLLHSTLLLGAAWLLATAVGERGLAIAEVAWKTALVGGLLTATLQLGLDLRAPTRIVWEPPAAAIAAPTGAAVERTLTRTTATLPSGGQLASTAPSSAANGGSWQRFLPVVWGVVAPVLTLLMLLSHLLLSRRLRSRRATGGRLERVLRRLESEAGSRRPADLSTSHEISIPLARGLFRGEICLPEKAIAELGGDAQETVIAHELAHLERRDPRWLFALRLLESVLFFQPLNRLARRRWQQVAEYRCDDWAVATTGRPVAMARSLTEVAGWALSHRSGLSVPAMAVEPSRLRRRVARLLERDYPRPGAPVPGWLRPALLTVLVLAVVAAPGVGLPDGDEGSAAKATGAPSTDAPPAAESAEPARLRWEVVEAPPAPPVSEVASPPTAAVAPTAPRSPSAPAAPTDLSSLPTPAPAPPAPSAPPARPGSPSGPPPPAPPAPPPTDHRFLSTDDDLEALAEEIAQLAESTLLPLRDDLAVLAGSDLSALAAEMAGLAGEIAGPLEGLEERMSALDAELAGLADGLPGEGLHEMSRELARGLAELAPRIALDPADVAALAAAGRELTLGSEEIRARLAADREAIDRLRAVADELRLELGEPPVDLETLRQDVERLRRELWPVRLEAIERRRIEGRIAPVEPVVEPTPIDDGDPD